MLTRSLDRTAMFTSAPHFTGRGKGKKPAPIKTSFTPDEYDTAAAQYRAKRDKALQAYENREGATQEELAEEVRKSGRLSANFIKAAERAAMEPDSPLKTRKFVQEFKSYLPTLQAQANDPKHPAHEYSKRFIEDLAALEREKQTATPSTSAQDSFERLQPLTYKPKSHTW